MPQITTYIKNETQEGRILNLLRERGSRGVDVWEFMLPRPSGGLGIAQYNARIFGLRHKGCIIKNRPIGHFILKFDPEANKEGQLSLNIGNVENLNQVRF